jgi:hypothetical protein
VCTESGLPWRVVEVGAPGGEHDRDLVAAGRALAPAQCVKEIIGGRQRVRRKQRHPAVPILAGLNDGDHGLVAVRVVAQHNAYQSAEDWDSLPERP